MALVFTSYLAVSNNPRRWWQEVGSLKSVITRERLIDASLRPFIQYFERIYTQNLVMKTMLQETAATWRETLHQRTSDSAERRKAKELFSVLYDSLKTDEEFHDAIQTFMGIKKTL